MTTHSMCMNVKGFLKNAKYPRGYKDVFIDDDERTLSPAEARDFLLAELEKGRQVIPCSGECGNPCKHADKGCTGFDYSGGGCPGRNTDALSDEEVPK